MLVAVNCIDKAGALQVRLDNRAAHLEYIAQTGIVAMAGPYIEAGSMMGSLIVLNVDTMQQAQDWASGDPYAKAGLFASVDIREWKKVIG